MMPGYPGYWIGWPGAITMLISSLVWIGLLVTGIVLLVHWLNTRPLTHQTFPTPSAIEILRQRYARGEIDAATFAKMRADLEASNQGNMPPAHGAPA